MKNTFEKIQFRIDLSFRSFMSQTLRLQGIPLKYFYWSLNFFETVANLSFEYFPLNQKQKNHINDIGKSYFDDPDIYFQVNRNSHRHDILIRNIHKLFPEDERTGQSARYEYLKEFILWDILENIQKKEEVNKTIRVVEVQKKNFLLTHLAFLTTKNVKPPLSEFDNYIKFTITSQGEELLTKLNELDSKGIKNLKLRKKLDALYVHKNEESKIHFIFSRAGGEEKEELRELLDVMGREKTGKLYRGQADATWHLDSSLTREPEYLKNETEMYYEILSLKPDAFINDHTVYERLITMQHFGMPTRLLDVTRNPLVAIFFACNNLQRINKDGIVYTFAPNETEFLNFEDVKLNNLKLLFDKSNTGDQKKPGDFLDSICFIKGIAKNQRISSQSGDFIFVGSGENNKEKLSSLPAATIIIDALTKRVLLEQLESLNIHGGAVYPDLTHMSNYIRNKYLGAVKKDIPDPFSDDDETAPPEDLKKIEKLQMEHSASSIEESKEQIKNIESEPFWTKKRLIAFYSFVKKTGLNEGEAKKIIEDWSKLNRKPSRSDIARLMSPKPKLQDYEKLAQPILDKMAKLAATLNDLND